MNAFEIIYTTLGGLGIFLFGMKQMSDGLQATSNEFIRSVIAKLTSNRILAVLAGLLVTCIIQSSSVTTVMTVGFVNAGLMTLKQAVGVIFGANIGTTITGWIIAVKVDKYGLLLVGLGFLPFLFSRNDRSMNIGRIILGVGLVFIGLQTMSKAFVPLRESQSFLDFIAYFAGDNYQSYFLSVLVGCLLTFIVQSSSAMLGITITLATTGVISYHTAVSLVLGENIGTTITAILASLGANTNAKRAARAHASFNLIGVSVMLTILPFYFDFIEWFVPGDAMLRTEDGSFPNVAEHIAMAHTMFNVTATLTFLPFINYLVKFVTFITPDESGKEKKRLQALGDSRTMVPATSLALAESEVRKMADIVLRMSEKVESYMHSKVKNEQDLNKIMEYEKITDNMQAEVTKFLGLVMEKEVTKEQAREVESMIKIADELESIADYLERLALAKEKNGKTFSFEGETEKEFFNYLGEVRDYVVRTFATLQAHHDEPQILHLQNESHKLKERADQLRGNYIARVTERNGDAASAITYSDMVVALRKIRAHSYLLARHSKNLFLKEN